MLDEVGQLKQSLATIAEVCGDLKDQRDARDQENRRLRAHVAALLRALSGKAKRREVTAICIAAQRELEQPLKARPASDVRGEERKDNG
jgi:hypothetical protein